MRRAIAARNRLSMSRPVGRSSAQRGSDAPRARDAFAAVRSAARVRPSRHETELLELFSRVLAPFVPTMGRRPSGAKPDDKHLLARRGALNSRRSHELAHGVVVEREGAYVRTRLSISGLGGELLAGTSYSLAGRNSRSRACCSRFRRLVAYRDVLSVFATSRALSARNSSSRGEPHQFPATSDHALLGIRGRSDCHARVARFRAR